MEWRVDQTLKLINLYRQFECLWNYKSATYKKADLKNNAWVQIAKEMRKEISEIKKKIKHLRTAYLAEKKKVGNRKKSDSSAEFSYKPRLYYYTDMSFLDSVVTLRPTISNFESDSVEFATESIDPLNTATEFSPQNSATCPSPLENLSASSSNSFSNPSYETRQLSNRKSRRDLKFNSAVDAIIASVTSVEKETLFTSFGKTIALQLEKLPLAEATETMSEIHNLLTAKILAQIRASENIAGCEERLKYGLSHN